MLNTAMCNDWVIFTTFAINYDTDTMLEEKIGIIESIDDFDIWAYIVAGYDFRGRLIIEYDYSDVGNHRNDYRQRAIIDADDVKTLSGRLSVAPHEIPSVIKEELGSKAPVADISTVRYAFKEILLFIVEKGAQYKLETYYGERH